MAVARRAARTDRNQREIVDALRKAGATVAVTSSVGDGFPDLTVGLHGETFLLEVKDGEKCPSERRLTMDQARFHLLWRGHRAVVGTVEEALREIGAVPRRSPFGLAPLP